jgi:hypothetical protein
MKIKQESNSGPTKYLTETMVQGHQPLTDKFPIKKQEGSWKNSNTGTFPDTVNSTVYL